MDKPEAELKITETLFEDSKVEYIPFKAGTRITFGQNSRALLTAAIKEKTLICNCMFEAGSLLTFSGTGDGVLKTAEIVGRHNIHGVNLSADNQPILLQFEKPLTQLQPGLTTATARGAPLKANELLFKSDSPLIFYRPGHIGAGDLQNETLINGIWFGPRSESTKLPKSQEQLCSSSTEPQSTGEPQSRSNLTAGATFLAPDLEHDIGFYATQQVAYATLSRQQTIDGYVLEAGSRVYFYQSGRLFGGTLAEQATIDGIKCNGIIKLTEPGKLLAAALVDEQTISGIACVGQVKFYDDGKLLGSTLARKQKLGSIVCEGHFTLHNDGSPKNIYMGETDAARGRPYNEGWHLRLTANGYRGYSQRPPGSWKKERFDLVSEDGSDFLRYYYPIAAKCTNTSCSCHFYDPVDSSKFNSEIRNYQRKARALMNNQRFAEAEQLQKKALEIVTRHKHAYGEGMSAELCRDEARTLIMQGNLDEALVMLDQAEVYWQKHGKDRRNYQVEQCHIMFEKCQIYSRQKDFSKLEPLVIAVIERCENDPRPDRINSLHYWDLSEAEKFLGDCFMNRNDFEQAETHYLKALSIDKNEHRNLSILRAYRELLLKTNKTEKAAEFESRISTIEQQPPSGWCCGNGRQQETAALEWQPTLKLSE